MVGLPAEIRSQIRNFTHDKEGPICQYYIVVAPVFPYLFQEVSLSAETISTQNFRFKTGWITLLLIAALMALMHFGLAFFLDNPVLFTGFTAFNLYAFIVILIPFRRVEKWAWLSTWILPVGLALPAINDPEITLFYFVVAALCVLRLLLTMRDFFSKSESQENRND
jgi:hypothetical protein